MSVRIVDWDIRMLQQRTRMPFRYGIATMTEFPLLFLRLSVEVDGKLSLGVSSDLLPPKWFTKDPDKAPDDEIDEMLRVIERAVALSSDLIAPNVFSFWRELYGRQEEEADRTNLPGLLVHFGTSLVERAIIDATTRARGQSFATFIRDSKTGIDLGSSHAELAGAAVDDFLPGVPLKSVFARHTIGLLDPLSEEEIESENRLDDGLPQSLDQCIRRYGLKHFKIKISGQPKVDLPRLDKTMAVIFEGAGSSVAFTLDANEQFRSMDEFQSYWEDLRASAWFASFFERLLFVEQPLHRDVALETNLPSTKEAGESWPKFIIDESDGDLNALVRALKLGYNGTSHKNCKGVFKGLLNRCLIEKKRRDNTRSSYLMSGEDLCNQGPIGLQQDLAVMACLGIESVERNGHHYCRGLSGLPQSIQERVEKAHPDLYSDQGQGWSSLEIHLGRIELGSVNQAPFGYGFDLPVDSLPTLAQWRAERGA